MLNNSSFLKKALLADSVLSFLVGIDLLLFSKAIASFFGLSASWGILAAGVVCLLYGVAIYLTARAEPIPLGIARIAAYGNLIGAFGIAALVFLNVMPLSTAGKWTVALLADGGLVLAIFQHVGLRRVAR